VGWLRSGYKFNSKGCFHITDLHGTLGLKTFRGNAVANLNIECPRRLASVNFNLNSSPNCSAPSAWNSETRWPVLGVVQRTESLSPPDAFYCTENAALRPSLCELTKYCDGSRLERCVSLKASERLDLVRRMLKGKVM
jgi:hypothetical protein